MFRRLAQATQNARLLASLHPVELVGLMEQAWNLRMLEPATSPPPTGHPLHRSDVPGIEIAQLPVPVAPPPSPTATSPSPAAPFVNHLNSLPSPSAPTIPFGIAGSAVRGVWWDHLIYAYMIENTRIYEIFRRVVHEFLHGEKLGSPTEETQLWLRSTEELFYRDPPPFSITTVSSHIRPDLRATRRNAYLRMFGMELNHGADDNTPYTYVRPEAANNEFVSTFEELLREVWIGHVHRDTTGPKPTDDAKIAELAHRLHDMLMTRRQFGNLSREEFFSVATMSWFHMTVENNLPIILDLRATATSPEQKLFRIASMVGLPAHGLSRSYFEIAEAISTVLIAIETGSFNTTAAAPEFYHPQSNNLLPDLMNTIITNWTAITGRNMKAARVSPN
jgi:hypothetical protein